MSTSEQKKGLATTSLVLGILSIICFGPLTGLPAIITGHIAHGRTRKSPEQYGGAGMAIAGFVLGYVSLFLTLVILPAMLLPALAKAKARAQTIHCVNNLKQVGLAFHLWAGDNNGAFPFNVGATNGGTLEFCQRDADGFDPNAFRHFQVLSNELNLPRILVCVADSAKRPAADFASLQANNVSYLLRSDESLLPNSGSEVLARCPIHGHVLHCDGSVTRERIR